jgi:hypothetical protein
MANLKTISIIKKLNYIIIRICLLHYKKPSKNIYYATFLNSSLKNVSPPRLSNTSFSFCKLH